MDFVVSNVVNLSNSSVMINIIEPNEAQKIADLRATTSPGIAFDYGSAQFLQCHNLRAGFVSKTTQVFDPCMTSGTT